MIRRLAAISFATRILAVAAVACVVLATSLFFVVKQTVEADMLHQARQDVVHASNFHRYLVDQKGTPAIADGNLAFGTWVANGDHSVVDTVKQKMGAEATLFQLIDGKLIRVTTTVLKLEDGARGVGTELIGPAAPRSSAVRATPASTRSSGGTTSPSMI